MLTFLELLKKLDLKNRNLEDKDILIKNIFLNGMKLNIEFELNESVNKKDLNEFEISLKRYLKEFIITTSYKENFLEYKNEKELIISEILNYNPSANVWIKELTINVDKANKNILISLPNASIYELITENGLKDHLESKLSIFGKYDIKFLSGDKGYTCKIEEVDNFILDIENEEKKLCKDISDKAQNIQKHSNNDVNAQNYSYGKRNIKDITLLKDLNISESKTSVKVDIFDIDTRELKNKKNLITLWVTDYTSSFIAKIFLDNKESQEFLSNIQIDDTVIISGNIKFDSFIKQNVIMINYIEKSSREIRKDLSTEKRVELRIHSKMSMMNGVSSYGDFAKRAKYWGMDSIAITDKANVQGFPEAMAAGSKYGLKILYGLDANFVDDEEDIIKNIKNDNLKSFVVFDIETTGFSPRNDKITEIGAVKVVDGIIVDSFSQLINPEKTIPQKVVELTGISNSLVDNMPTIEEVIPKFYNFCKDNILVAHNASFDVSFIKKFMTDNGLNFDFTVLDTLSLARAIVKDIKRFNLSALSKRYGVSLVGAHRAVNDAQATAEIFIKMLEQLKKDGIDTLYKINELKKHIDSTLLFESSVSILVKNNIGLKNLYKLVSESHMKYINRVAKVPKSLIDKYREGLLIGSGDSTSPLYKAVFNMKSEEEILKIASYYDYIEIQPVKNNLNFIINGMLSSYEDLKDINREIVRIAEKANIPVVANSDSYYLDNKDDITRRIILNGVTGRPIDNASVPQELNFKTTDEMIEEFSYLGEEKAYEVVIKNTNMIKNMCETINPIPDGTYPPVIEGSDEELKKMCYKKAHEIYGDELPEIIKNRLEKELNSIISNGYAVLYIIAQKLVKKSNDDGYLVGSRGSVGSSFVATMSSITEVNPLPAHYICPNCKYSEFVEGFLGSGVDLPNKKCPKCNTELIKEGHNIPFEVFLGFNGDKEPDIDLNFAGEYQPIAHKYTEELFGEGYVFRAGTIGTVAEKTAYMYVKKFFENREESIPQAEIDRLTKSAIGVKRTSGQHPGGVMIVPRHKEIFDFTPIQYPADDKNAKTITTHFDYNFIHGKILKLDILGHDGPTFIRMLEDITNTKSIDVPLDDKRTISLFTNSDNLGLNKDIFDTDTGTLGIPEFGTNFVKQMLLETKPKNFSDLVRISGLSHGTDVWTNNAQELVKQNRAKLEDVISTREDIMVYLINAGAENKMAFDTMEKVRKGKGLTDSQKEIMKKLPLPEWYIEACERIKYMFPKAHAVAYVMLSFRIAYYKLNYPLAYYATYFTIKLADFDGELILKGPDAIKKRIEEISSQEKLSAKDKGQLNILYIVLEMYARNFEFKKADIYKSNASSFLVSDNKILLPLRAYMGVSQMVADSIVEEREKSKFLSIEDLMNRTKVTKSICEILRNNSLLDSFPKTNQLDMFSMF